MVCILSSCLSRPSLPAVLAYWVSCVNIDMLLECYSCTFLSSLCQSWFNAVSLRTYSRSLINWSLSSSITRPLLSNYSFCPRLSSKALSHCAWILSYYIFIFWCYARRQTTTTSCYRNAFFNSCSCVCIVRNSSHCALHDLLLSSNRSLSMAASCALSSFSRDNFLIRSFLLLSPLSNSSCC